MQLTYRGISYNAEAPTLSNTVPAPVVGKYRGVEFITVQTTVPTATAHRRKYRGISY
ncbi:MAG: DUF4278 domain-containing protein [Kovacikia sp.]